MKKEIEIERRFLLKKFPDAQSFTQLCIHQFYVKEDGIIVRYRKTVDWDFQEVIFQKFIKKNISKGINEETQFEITRDEFNTVFKKEKIPSIHKDRYIFRYEDNGPFFEVDVFHRKTPLVICEVELKSLDQEFTIPPYIQEVIEREITGETEYSNYNLSLDGQNL
jgi:CYTH domain-containing protein